jgi:hypothetical protein
MRRRRLLCLLRGLAAVAAASWWAGPVAADTAGRLVDALDNARSYKVRVQAATLLARLRDPRVAEALARAAASDPHTTVRVVTLKLLARGAAAGRLPMSVARQTLNRALQDSDAPVRRQATVSLAELDRGNPEPDPSPRAPARPSVTTVAVGSIGDRSGRASRALREQMRAQMRALLAREPRVQISDSQTGVTFLVDGTISRLTLSQGGPTVEMLCAVELVVSRPPRGIISVASGEAIVQKPRAYFHQAARERMEADALEHAIRSAHENLAQFLANQ